MESRSQSSRQTFKVDLSTIPNRSMVSKVTVMVCHKKSRQRDAANALRASICLSGVCSDSGKDVMTPGNNYHSSTQIFNVNFNKATSTILEIGAAITGNRNTSTRVSAISAFVTYAPPAGAAPAVTPPQRSGGSGVVPTHALFTGQTYPGGSIDLTRQSPHETFYGYHPEETSEVSASGDFRILNRGLLQSNYYFALRGVDVDGRKSAPLIFNADFISTDRLIKEGIVLPPTLEIKDAKVFGYAAPGSVVKIELDGKSGYETRAGSSGYYELSIPSLSEGSHQVTARQEYQNRGSLASFVAVGFAEVKGAINMPPEPPNSANFIDTPLTENDQNPSEETQSPPPTHVIEQPKIVRNSGTLLFIALSLTILVGGLIAPKL